MGRKKTWMFPKIGGKPPKWMVKIMEHPMNKWDDLGVFPLFLVQHPYLEFIQQHGDWMSDAPK